MPTVQPKELWEETGRWQKFGAQLLKLKDPKNQEVHQIKPDHMVLEALMKMAEKNVGALLVLAAAIGIADERGHVVHVGQEVGVVGQLRADGEVHDPQPVGPEGGEQALDGRHQHRLDIGHVVERARGFDDDVLAIGVDLASGENDVLRPQGIDDRLRRDPQRPCS